MSQTPPILYAVSHGVAAITINRPTALNALNIAAIAELRELAVRAAADTTVRAVLLTGEGRAFCAGGDVKEMGQGWLAADADGRQRAALEGAASLHGAIATLHRMSKPVLCAVNGPAAGAGVGVACSADIVWAAQSSSFTLAYTAIGLSPDGGTSYFLPRCVGAKLAAELILTNRTLTADEALRAGLVSRVLPDADLMTEARGLAERLASGPTRAYAEVRALLRTSSTQSLEAQLEDERQAIARTTVTADFAEGVTAFAAKRSPRFKGS